MWYVLWTNEGKEIKTKSNILNHVEPSLFNRVAVPRRKKRHFFQGESKIVTLLLFPSYVFVESNRIKDLVSVVEWFPGKNQVLQIDDFYCPISGNDIFLLDNLMNDNDVIDISEGYMENGSVTVTKGPLKGYEKYIKKLKRRSSVAILSMNLFNKTVEYSLGLDILGDK